MSELLYGLLAVLLVLYAIGFLYETVMSFRRLASRKREIYPVLSWEVIHTTLVITFATFMITHGPMLEQLAPLIMIPFMIAMLGFFIRSVCQLIIFFGRTDPRRHTWIDQLFALSHIIILLPFLYAVTVASWYLMTHQRTVLTDMLGWFVPGLLVGICLNLLPIISIFRGDQSRHK